MFLCKTMSFNKKKIKIWKIKIKDFCNKFLMVVLSEYGHLFCREAEQFRRVYGSGYSTFHPSFPSFFSTCHPITRAFEIQQFFKISTGIFKSLKKNSKEWKRIKIWSLVYGQWWRPSFSQNNLKFRHHWDISNDLFEIGLHFEKSILNIFFSRNRI